MNENKSGFTLIEVVVVLSVVAILAAILTPSIVKSINDSKIARANNEVQVIGAAMAAFYKDLGRWPTKQNAVSTNNYYFILYGAGNPMAAGSYSEWWSSDGISWTQKDIFNNHLARNTPGGATDPLNRYTLTGKLKWNGPYLTTIDADPWNTHYSCNIRNLWDTTPFSTYAVYVLSAGENIIADTSHIQVIDTLTEPVLTGDDIGFRMK
jgi:prepilin-type N-terminal cleavage/methylation domain-containing protein